MFGVGTLEVLILFVLFIVVPILLVRFYPKVTAAGMGALLVFWIHQGNLFYAANQREIQRLLDNYDRYADYYVMTVRAGAFLLFACAWSGLWVGIAIWLACSRRAAETRVAAGPAGGDAA